MNARRLYAVGCGLGVVGSLAVLASLAAAEMPTVAVGGVGSLLAFVLCLKSTYEREDFDRDHSRGYRALNLFGAVLVVGLGLVVLAAGVLSYRWFVVGTLT